MSKSYIFIIPPNISLSNLIPFMHKIPLIKEKDNNFTVLMDKISDFP
jgi:hypothetical protein